MATIDEFIRPASSFLKADDVGKNPEELFTITEEPKVIHNEKFGKDRLRIKGTFLHEERTLDCGKNNAREIVSILGNDLRTWVGRELMLNIIKVQTKDGLKDSMFLKQVKGA